MHELLDTVRRHKVNIDGNICTVMVTILVLEVNIFGKRIDMLNIYNLNYYAVALHRRDWTINIYWKKAIDF